MRRYKNFPKAPYFLGVCAMIALAAVTITITITANVFLTDNDTDAIVSVHFEELL